MKEVKWKWGYMLQSDELAWAKTHTDRWTIKQTDRHKHIYTYIQTWHSNREKCTLPHLS